VAYRAGIVGCGRIGCSLDDEPRRGHVSTHAGAYKRTNGVELVALCDVDESKLITYGRKWSVRGCYMDVRTMLAAERLDILSVCTRSNTHLDVIRSAVDWGVKAIFCEKPIADTLGDADAVISICAERNVLLMVDHQRRFDPFHQQIAALLRNGALGSIQQVTCYYTAGVVNTGSHLFDLLRFYLGDASWVVGQYSRNSSWDPSDPNIDGWIGFAGGPVAAVQACDVKAYLIFEINLLGIAGRLRITSSGFAADFEQARESKRFAGYKELVPATCPVHISGEHEFMLYGAAHLLDCLNDGKEPISSGYDARAALEMICALRESASSNGRRIELPVRCAAAQEREAN
jgi:predicted dehydrogenase